MIDAIDLETRSTYRVSRAAAVGAALALLLTLPPPRIMEHV